VWTLAWDVVVVRELPGDPPLVELYVLSVETGGMLGLLLGAWLRWRHGLEDAPPTGALETALPFAIVNPVGMRALAGLLRSWARRLPPGLTGEASDHFKLLSAAERERLRLTWDTPDLPAAEASPDGLLPTAGTGEPHDRAGDGDHPGHPAPPEHDAPQTDAPGTPDIWYRYFPDPEALAGDRICLLAVPVWSAPSGRRAYGSLTLLAPTRHELEDPDDEPLSVSGARPMTLTRSALLDLADLLERHARGDVVVNATGAAGNSDAGAQHT
jgi:hypothetical protein